MLRSVYLDPSILLVFCYNFVRCGLFATKFCTHSATDNVCAYIVAKLYVGTYGLATIYADTRK